MEWLVEGETITGNPNGERKSRLTEAPLTCMNYRRRNHEPWEDAILHRRRNTKRPITVDNHDPGLVLETYCQQ